MIVSTAAFLDVVPHDGRYYVYREGFDDLDQALLHAAALQLNGEKRSIPVHRNGEIVALKRF